MSKRKTKQQKVITDLRRQLSSHQTTEVSDPPTQKQTVLPTSYIQSFTKQSSLLQTPSYTSSAYFFHDLQRVVLLTTTIVVGELTLFFLLKQHIVTLPLLNY